MLKKSISRKKCWDANLVATGHPTVILRTLRFFGLNQKGIEFFLRQIDMQKRRVIACKLKWRRL